jgi:hypothetical protein
VVTFSVRFYGRFVLARERKQSKPTGRITFLAPNLELRPEIGPHMPIMSIARSSLVKEPIFRAVPPTFRTIANGDPQTSEYLIWDLAGTTVTVPSADGVDLKMEATIPDLGDLEKSLGRSGRLNKKHLQPGGEVNATIELAGGQGRAFASFKNKGKVIPESDARDGNPINDVPDKNFGEKEIADFVEINIPVNGNGAGPAELGTLALQLRGKTNGTILVEAGPEGATIGFSNLCATCPREAQAYDFEFAQYYRLLEETGPDHLILMIDHLGDEDCNESAQVFYDND